MLFGMSGQIEASELTATLTMIGEKAAAESLAKMESKLVGEGASTVFAKTLTDASKAMATKIEAEFATKLGAKGVDQAAVQSEMKVAMQTSMKSLAESAIKLEGLGVKVEALGADSLTKLGSASISDFDSAIDKLVMKGDNAMVKQAGALTEAQATTLKQEFAQAKAALAPSTSIEQMISKQLSGVTGGFDKIMGKGVATDAAKAARVTLQDTTATFEAKNAALASLKEEEYAAATVGGRILRRLSSVGGKLVGPLEMAVGTLGLAVLFMIPSIFQSAFLAQQAQNALLETYLPPTKFGNVVMQLPDSVVNMGNPAMSQFIYYGIPVANPGDGISAAAQAAYPGVSGPDKHNKISAAVNNTYAQAFSAGSTKKLSIPRYNLDARALATLPIFVMYSELSYVPWASNGISDASFTQKMVNLNTGYVMYADGSSQGTPPVSLVGPKATTDTVESFMATELGKLQSAGSQATYTQYEQAYSSSKGSRVASSLSGQFNCKCLSENNPNGILSSDIIKTCSAPGSTTCLLTSTLNQLAAGLVINSSGKVMAPGQDLATEVAQGALGQVIPIQGLGSGFDAILQMFPGAQQNALANSGVLTVSVSAGDLSSTASAATTAIQGAPADNYSAKGVYVYQCKNTPLAKILRSQAGGSAAANSQIVDYIVFLDANLNQVPMMAPVQDPTNYNFITMGLNPEIAYFSTIIGNLDSTGNFSFLPQLNIQSPAALVAKGLPATFPPLYGLSATNGSLSVNYNQNLTSTIGAIATALVGHAKLGQQFKTMQAAMLGALLAGPFGKYNLSPVAANMQPVIGGVNLNLYTGFNGYPVSQDQANAACTDVLIPLSSAGKTVTLPSNSVAQYYGLVTDLTYTVGTDGSITVGAKGFANSPLSAAGKIDTTKTSQFYWMNKLTAMGQSNDPSFVMPQPLVDFVTAARAAWVTAVQAMPTSGLSQVEFTGVAVAGTPSVLTIVNQQALQSGLYLYTCSPSPSSLAMQDYFVVTNSSSPQATDASLGKMSVTKATAATNMLSVVSGSLYNMSGTQVMGSSGAAYSVNAATLLTALNTANPQALSNDIKAKLNIAVSQTTSAAMAMVYPFAFGGLQLGLYQADINAHVYLYFDASGAGASADFQPSDYFVTVDSYTSPSTIGTKISATTAFVVSLVSGQVSGPSGVVATMPASVLSQIIGTLSPQWRSGIAAQITTLAANLAAATLAQEQQTATMNNAPVATTSVVTWPQASVMQVITAIASLSTLADPYGMLKQDPTSGMYVLVTPANTDGTQFMYTFFNVPSTTLDANGNPINVGASYDDQGNLLRVIQGIELASMMRQSGVSLDSTGKQYLGANNSLPIMQLDPADLALQPGMSGKSMIVSNDPNFPSHGIVSPVSYQNSQFYFYYNTITLGYYAMQVNGADIRYIDMAGGCIYNLNGSPRMASNPVAVNSNGDATDLLLPYLNPDGFTRCVMKNADNKNAYTDFYNSEQDFQAVNDVATNNPCGLNLLYSLDGVASAVNVAQMPFPDPTTLTAMPDLSVATQYNVYFDQSATPVSYAVNSTYQWQQLQILPINMTTRTLLSPLPADVYTTAGLVTNSSGMYAMVFANQFYSGAQKTGTNSYTMTSGANSLVVSTQMDAKTNTQYVQVIAGGVTYNYQCSFATLTDSQLIDYRHNAWQAEIVADVTGKILLEQYISIDTSGNLLLMPVSNSSVTNMPTDPVAKSAITAALGIILQDGGNGRFMAPVSAATYPYFTQAGYVDLENGVLFNATGLLVGYTIQYADLLNLLSSLSIAVTRDANNKATLIYRAPMLTAAINTTTAATYPSYVPSAAPVSQAPAQTYTPTYNPATVAQVAPVTTYTPSAQVISVQSQAQTYNPATVTQAYTPAAIVSAPVQAAPQTYTPAVAVAQAPASLPADYTYDSNGNIVAVSSQNSAAAPVAQAPVQSYAPAAPVAQAQAASTNPQIVQLQNQIKVEQADIADRNKALAHEKIAKRRQVLQNAILTDKQQIALDNQQIVSLGGTAAAKSNVLGRYSSQSKKAKSHVKKNKK